MRGAIYAIYFELIMLLAGLAVIYIVVCKLTAYFQAIALLLDTGW